MATNEEPKDLLDWLGFTSKPDWKVARPLGYAMGIATILLFSLAVVTAFWTLLQTLITPSTASLGAGTLVVALLGAPFLIWRTIIAHRTLGFQKEGHITDRISKAVELLGADKVIKKQRKSLDGLLVFEKTDGHVDYSKPTMVEETLPSIESRIGGILSLERIAQDSTTYDNGRDHVRVMEILTAYIRENSRNTSLNYPQEISYKSAKETVPEIFLLREDIKIALNVIGRRTKTQKLIEANWLAQSASILQWPFDEDVIATLQLRGQHSNDSGQITAARDFFEQQHYSGYRIDLSGSNLENFNFNNFDLCGAKLNDCNLKGTTFSNSLLVGASIKKSNLRTSKLKFTDISAADFSGADLSGATMLHTDCHETEFNKSTMFETVFESSILYKCDAKEAALEKSRFRNTALNQCNFSFSRFHDAEIENCKIIACKFEGANLCFKSFWLSWLHKCDLNQIEYDFSRKRAGLRAIFSTYGENLQAAESVIGDLLGRCFGDASVNLPPTINERPPHWPRDPLDFDELKLMWMKWKQNH